MKHAAKVIVALAVTVGLLWWAVSDVAFADVWANVRQGNPWLLLASAAVTTFGFLLRALRWSFFLAPVKPNSALSSRFASVSIHFMANNLLWLRVGEFARAWVFARLESVPVGAAFGSVVVERLLDGVVLLLFLIVPVLLPGFPEVSLLDGAGGVLFKAAVLAVLAVMGVLAAMAAFPRAVVGLADRIAGLLPRALGRRAIVALESFLASIAVLRDPKLLAWAMAWSLFFWAYQALSFWLGMLAFGIDIGYWGAVFTSSVVGFGVALPSTPGFFGAFHAAVTFAVSDVYGVPAAQSLAFAFAYHFAGWVPITLIGLYFVWRLGLSLSEVGAAEESVAPGPDARVRPAPDADGVTRSGSA